MSILPRERLQLQPVQVTGAWLLRPIAPCELMPRGFPGVLTINSRPYLCSIIGELPDEGEPVVRGYRLVKDDWECSCPDNLFRGGRAGGCKHIAALRQALSPSVQPRR